jgi:NAD-specific glutamate dehydrogenase
LVSTSVSSLNVTADETLKVISNKLHNDDTLVERSALQAETIMKLLEICLRTTYFQMDGKHFQQKDGMAMKLSITNH